MSKHSTRFAFLAVPLIFTIAQSAPAQAGSAAKPSNAAAPTVVIIQAATLPEPGGRAVVVRQRDANPRDIIVLPAQGATTADLASALSLLARASQEPGPLPAPQLRISISSAAFAGGQPPGVEQYFRAILERLSRAPVIDVPGVASGPAVTVPQNRPDPG